MFKKIILILALICMIVSPIFSQTGTYTTHGHFYLPEYGAYGDLEYQAYNAAMEGADNQIEANKTTAGGVSISGTPVQYDYARFTNATTIEGRSYSEMKTDLAYQLSDLSDVGVTTSTDKYVLVADGDSWESRVLVEADISDLGTYLEDITGEILFDLSDVAADPNADRFLMWDDDPGNNIWHQLVEADISDLGTYLEDITGESIFDLSDVSADPNADKYPKWDDDPGEIVWVDASGYTNLTSFVDQTAWRLFYSNTDGDVIELPFGADGTYLGSTGATSAPTFSTPSGAGDMLKATYDTDADGDIDVAAGGTEKSSWTLYAIPYLSGTTTFGEITIGTAEYCLTVNAGANGYDWTLFDLSLYYLKTEIDTQSEVETIWGVALVNDGDLDSYYLKTAIDTQGEMETIWGDTLMNDLVDDPAPELGGEMDAGAHSIGFTLQSTTGDGTTTIDWQLGNKFKFTFGAQNETFTFTAPTNPCTLMLTIIQDATGSRTVTWPATVKWAGGVTPTLTTTANARDKVALDWDGTQYDGVCSKDFK